MDLAVAPRAVLLPLAMTPVAALIADLETTQREFGESIGLSQPRVSELANGDPVPGDVALRIMEQYGRRLRRLGFDLGDLLRGQAA
jgi:hypothetical protein